MLAIIFFIVIPLVLFFYFKYNIGSILVVAFFLAIFYYTPYSYYLEPSYWQFRNMCKLNELPNNEEKYNKILKYFNADLDTLDWEGLERTWKLKETNGYYKKGIYEYAALTQIKKINSRIKIIAEFLSNESKINPYNINQMSIDVYWYIKRFYPDGNEGSGFYWNEDKLSCIDVIEYNMTPKETNNDEQRNDK